MVELTQGYKQTNSNEQFQSSNSLKGGDIVN